MSDSSIRFESIPWRRLMPWLHLTRAFWIAVDLRKLALAAIALLVVAAGSLVFDLLPFSPASRGETATERWPWEVTLGYELPYRRGALPEFRGVLEHPSEAVINVLGNWRIVLYPLRALSEPAARLFRGYSSWQEIADAATRLLWALVVWSIFGGAIGRMAAVQFARDQQVGMGKALKFALGRFFGYFSAPLLPLGGVAILWALCVIGGWLARIPGGIGPVVLGVLWGLELVFGLMMAVVLIGVAAGWPLMLATIGVEGTDGFDGLSRMYNYVFERPLYYAWQIGLALVYGSGVIFFVWLMAQLTVHLAVWGVSWGLGYQATAELLSGGPPLIVGGMRHFGDGSLPASNSLGAEIIRGWMCLLATFVVAFVYSYFWTCATIIYFTLRRSVDANDFDEVYLETEQEDDELLPLVGAAAMGETGQIVAANGKSPAASAEPPPVDLAP